MTTMYQPTTTPSDNDGAYVNATTTIEQSRPRFSSNISWGAIFAGTVVALIVHLLGNLLGIGIGAASLDANGGDNPSAAAFSMTAGIWWTISGIIASYVGAFVAGRLSGKPKDSTASWHGFTTWATTTLLIFYLLTSTVGGILGGVFSSLGSIAGGVGETAGGAIQTAAKTAVPALAGDNDPFGKIEQSIRNATGGQDPEAIRDSAIAAVRAAVTGDKAEADAARAQAVETLARATNITPEQAQAEIAQYEQQYRQMVEQAKETAMAAAEATRKAVSRGALFACLALALGAIAAWIGGRAGAVSPMVTEYNQVSHR